MTDVQTPIAKKPSANDAQVGDDSQTLQQLLATSGACRESAFAELYERTRAHVHGVVLKLLRSVDHTLEVVQETYLEVWLKAGLYDAARGSVKTWITMIAHRRAVDRVRLIESSRVRDARHAGLMTALVNIDIGDEVAAKVDSQCIVGAMNMLSPILRQAVMMKYVEDCTLEYMAKALALPLGTVKTRVRDGLINLRRLLRVTNAKPLEIDIG